MDAGTAQMSVAHAVGDRVQVRRAYPPGHTRAPYFMRGKVGIVADTAGVYRNPEELAYGIYDGARLRVYRVRFRQVDLWAHYRGSPHDTVYVDIYENWLERVTEAP